MGSANWMLKDIAQTLFLSAAEVTNSLNRSDAARLYIKSSKSVNRNNLYEFIVYGLPYVFPNHPGTLVNGIPTAHSHPHFEQKFSSEVKFVWPSIYGEKRGLAVEPLYNNQVQAIKLDTELYLLLACIDMLRVGRAREKEMAKEMLKQKLLNELSGKYNKDQGSL